MSNVCIFCDNENEAKSVEHIVPESLGNTDYVMPKGSVCDICNKKFSSFEDKALSNSILLMQRSIMGIKTKKGKNAKGRIQDLEIQGSKSFEPGSVTIKGLNEKNFIDYDSSNNTAKLVVKSFDKSSIPTTKLLLKIGLESLYRSEVKLYNKYTFIDLRNYLLGRKNIDWPVITIGNIELKNFSSVPKRTDKYNLKRIKCSVYILEKNIDTLLLRFSYGSIVFLVNLLNRNTEWISEFIINGFDISIYPEHVKTMILKSTT